MFPATCSNCGDACEVPFKPTGSKPVLCSNCFGNKGNANRSKAGRDRGNYFSDKGDRQMHKATCDDCGDACEVPFKPSGDKPIYCSNCFGKHNDRGGRGDGNRGGGFKDRHRNRGGGDNLGMQISALSGKLDKIIALLDGGTATKKSVIKKDVTTKSPAKKVAKKTVKKPTKKVAKKKK